MVIDESLSGFGVRLVKLQARVRLSVAVAGPIDDPVLPIAASCKPALHSGPLIFLQCSCEGRQRICSTGTLQVPVGSGCSMRDGQRYPQQPQKLTGCMHLQKCIAHRVARLYGLDSLTVLSSEKTPTVGVRRTKKCLQMPEVIPALSTPSTCAINMSACRRLEPLTGYTSELHESFLKA